MRPRLTQEDYVAFADFRREATRSQLEAQAAEQARQGGPPLTEMGMSAIVDWLRDFHAEVKQYSRDLSKADTQEA